jgi:hypothetical protein
VHNYYVKRSDGATAAERFFGAKPRELFEYLLDRLDLLRNVPNLNRKNIGSLTDGQGHK